MTATKVTSQIFDHRLKKIQRDPSPPIIPERFRQPHPACGQLGSTATCTDPAAMKTYLDLIRPALDIDGNGTADALTDGLLVIRYLFGLRGASLIAGAVEPLATRKTATDIEAYIQTLMP